MPNPTYKDFDEFVDTYCEQLSILLHGVTAAEVRNGMCDLAELRKSYEEGELSGDVAWTNYDDMCR